MATTRTVKLIARMQDRMTPGLRSVARGATAFAGAVAAAGAAAFAAAKKISDYGAKVFDLSTATGVSIEGAQALGYAFEQTGGSIESVGGAIRGLNTFMRTAATGGAEYMAVLDQLGITYGELRAMSPEDAFLLLTDRIGGMTDEMERNIAATTVFGGRYAQQIVSAVEQADGSLRNLTDAFNESGNAMSRDQVEALKKYSDAMTDLDYRMKALLADAITPMLPALKDTTDEFADLAEDVLPALIPALEGAIGIMRESLPTIIDLMNATIGGWEKLLDLMDGKQDTAVALQTALEEAVRTGAISAQEAQQEWERLTQAQQGWTDAALGMINPVHNAVTSIDNLTANYGILRQQQVIVARGFNEDAIAAFYAAEGTDAVAASGSRLMPILQAQGQALMGVAQSLWAMVQPMEGAGTIEEPITAAGAAATKLDITMKQILENMKEYFKVAKGAKDLIKDRSALEDEYLAKLMLQNEYQTSMEGQRLAAVEAAQEGMAAFASDMVMAAAQGEEAWSRFWDNFAARLLRTVSMNAFQMLLGVATGGIGGFFGSLFGFAGGTPSVPGGQPKYGAAGGMRAVPGSPGMQSDGVPIMAKPGEVVLNRSQVNQMGRGGSTYNVNVAYSPMFSSASNADISRMVPMIKKAIIKGGGSW